MRNYILILLAAGFIGLLPGPTAFAENYATSDTQAVIERANNLKILLDRLLVQSNHSSIQKALSDGGEASNPLIDEALRLKANGEQFLVEEDYMQAAVTLQAALDQVFQAIRMTEEAREVRQDSSPHLAEAISANDTFISAATRVVNGEPNGEAVELLASAREARAEADASAANGDLEAALQLLEESTDLAQKAIMSVRDGKVIERRQ